MAVNLRELCTDFHVLFHSWSEEIFSYPEDVQKQYVKNRYLIWSIGAQVNRLDEQYQLAKEAWGQFQKVSDLRGDQRTLVRVLSAARDGFLTLRAVFRAPVVQDFDADEMAEAMARSLADVDPFVDKAGSSSRPVRNGGGREEPIALQAFQRPWQRHPKAEAEDN